MKLNVYKLIFFSFLFFFAIALALIISNKIYQSVKKSDTYQYAKIYKSYGFNNVDIINSSKNSLVSFLKYYKTTIFDRPQPEILPIYINMNYKNHTSFLNRKEHFKWASTDVGDKKFKATINYNGNILPAKIYLKGITQHHRVNNSKFSFSLDLKKDNFIEGMKNLSFHAPHIRSLWNSCLWHDARRALNLITPKCGFVNVYINGKAFGVMQFVEKINYSMIERLERKPGVIIAPDEKKMFFMLHQGIVKMKKGEPQDAAKHFELISRDRHRLRHKVKKEKKILSNDVQKNQLLSALSLMDGFYKKKIDFHEAFVSDDIIKNLAILLTFGNTHAWEAHNINYFYSPWLNKFEVIPTDIKSYTPQGAIRPQNLMTKELITIFQNDNLRKKLVNQLYIIKKSLEDGDLGKSLNLRAKYYNSVLWKDYPFIPLYEVKYSIKNIEKVLANIDTYYIDANCKKLLCYEELPEIKYVPPNVEIIYPAIITYENSTDHTMLGISSRWNFPVIIKNINIADNKGRFIKTYKASEKCKKTIPLDNFYSMFNIKKELFCEIKLPYVLSDNEKILVEIFIPAQDKHYAVQAKLFKKFNNKDTLNSFLNINEILNLFSGSVSLEGKSLIFKNDINIYKKFGFPKGYNIIVEKGVVFNFYNNSNFLIEEGSLTIKGTNDDPVIFRSAKKNTFWNGFLVRNANNKSLKNHISNLHLENLKEYSYGPTLLTGSLNFVNSDVFLENVKINNNQSEDAINIIHSKININNLLVNQTKSDALDGDFIKGNINNSVFKNIGGDAVDVSGSNINLANIKFFNINDKAISIGEASHIDGQNINIFNTGVGIASKDGSTGKFDTVNVANSITADVMAYIKKNQYGPSQIIVNNSPKLYGISQKNSKILINNVKVREVDLNVKQMYKSGHMKK